jgi:hypothetical protein
MTWTDHGVRPARAKASPSSRTALVVAGAVALAAPVATLVDAPEPVRLPLAVALVCWAPGFALTRPVRIEEPFLHVAAWLAVSLAVTVLAAMALINLGGWTVVGVGPVVGTVTLVAVLAQIRGGSRR